MSIDRGMDKQDVVQIYSEAIKENEIMSFPGMWMDLEIIINEESQRKTNIIYYCLMWNIKDDIITPMVVDRASTLPYRE